MSAPSGRCVGTEGAVFICRSGGQEKLLLPSTQIRPGDQIRTDAGAIAALRFTDGTFVALGGGSLLDIEYYEFESDDGEDAAQFSLEYGSFIIESGDLALNADGFVVACGGSILALRSAWIAVHADPLECDLVTLLPSRVGPQGEVLTHNKVSMQVLSRPWQTLRLAGDDADIPQPLTMPSSVVINNFRETGIAAAIEAAVGADKSGQDVSEDFQRFSTLGDRFLERQFIARPVFPSDGPAKTGDDNALLEDAFDGTRFRLADPET